MTLPTRNAGVSAQTFSHPTLSWPRDTNNQRPAQAEPVMGGGDWRTQLHPSARPRIANKIMDKLKRHLPVSGPEGLHKLRKIAERFEEKIYSTATSPCDYLRELSLKMLTMETKFCNAATISLPSNSAGPNKKSSNGKKSTAGKKSVAGKKSHRSRTICVELGMEEAGCCFFFPIPLCWRGRVMERSMELIVAIVYDLSS